MNNCEVKLRCSCDGKLEPNKKICCVCGHTKVLYVNRNINLSAMLNNHCKICRERFIREFKYQCPCKDDNILISVHDEDDLENMMCEYDNMMRKYNDTKDNHDKMMRTYDNIRGEYDNMVREHNDMNHNYDKMMRTCDNICGEYDNKMRKYNDMKHDYDKMLHTYDNICGEYNVR